MKDFCCMGDDWIVWFDIKISRDEGMYVANCEGLGVASCAINEKLAIANLKYAIRAYCESLERLGLLEEKMAGADVNFIKLETYRYVGHGHKKQEGY